MLLLMCSQVQAEEWLETANDKGGKILLLKTLCKDSKTGHLLIATSSNGQSVYGCWWTFTDMIHAVFDNGETYAYDPKIFQYKTSKD